MRKNLILFFLLLTIGSCIERINIDVPNENASQLVVDGLITDEPGPYTVKLSLSSRISGFLQFGKVVTAKRVTIFDNAGNEEVLTEVETGTYQTKPDGIRGVIGREYIVRIETQDGKVYESIPDKMNPVGAVDSIYYGIDSHQPIDGPTQYSLHVFADTKALPGSDNLYRWKLTSVFEANTNPELRRVSCDDLCGCLKPRPCGCKCWVTQYETQPRVSSGNQYAFNGKEFKGINMGRIPFEYFPFKTKYRIEVKQMSLSQNAFYYWRIIQTQKEGAQSLFQPATGKTRTNIYEKSGLAEAQGLFYAAAVRSRHLYVTNKEVEKEWKRLQIPELWCYSGIMPEDCRVAFPFSSDQRPSDWQ